MTGSVGSVRDGQRKRTTYLLYAVVALLVAIGGFGPAYISGRNETALLELQCANARYNIAQLKATELTIKTQTQIAKDLSLPVTQEIQKALDAYVIPGVPPGCID
jgi:hypothetical protein